MSPLAVGMLAAMILGVGVPVALRRVDALDQWPRLAAWLWLVLPVGSLGALWFVAGLLALTDHMLASLVAEVLHTCASVLTAGLVGPVQARPLLAGALLALLAFGAVRGMAVGAFRARRGLRHHRDLLALTAVDDARAPGVRVLQHPTPVAYSLPGRPDTMVVSTGALERLTTEQLAAVIAHEEAHQRGRHHLLILIAEILRLGFPWLPAARLARAGVKRSVELAADDAAARRCGRRLVAQALLQLHHLPTTPQQLAMAGCRSGPTAAERVTRLLRPAPRSNLPVVASLGAVGIMLVLPPASIADPIGHLVGVALPLAHLSGGHMCPL